MFALLVQLLVLPMLAMMILYAFMARVLPLRKRWPWRLALILVFVFASGGIKLFWGMFSLQGMLVRAAAFPIMLVLAPLWLFEGPVWKRLVLNMLLYCSQMLGEAVCVQMFIPLDVAENVDAFFFQMPLSTLLLYAALSQGVTVILDCGIVILAKTFAARRFSPIYLTVFALPFCLWGMLLGHYKDYPSWVWFLCMFLGCVVTVALLYYIVSLEERDALREQVRELRHAMELEQAHYRTVEERREELARIRHDFNNHLSAIGRLMAGGEVDDARRMLALLREDLAATRESPYCAIPVVNAVLEEKARVCRKKGVELRVALELPERLTVEPLHLCSIFANLMDNAIRGAAASGAESPEVSLTARSGGDYLFIKTTNPCSESSGQGSPPAGRGLGLRICGEIAGRYDGSCQSTRENGVYTALVTVLACP